MTAGTGRIVAHRWAGGLSTGGPCCMSVVVVPVGIGNIETGQNARFQRFHGIRLLIIQVIIPQKMQKSVNDEMGHMMVKAKVRCKGLALNRLPREGQVAQKKRFGGIQIADPSGRKGGKGQDVGRPCLSAMFAVQSGHRGIVEQKGADLAVAQVKPKRVRCGGQGLLEPAGDERRIRPVASLDNHIDRGRGGFLIGVHVKGRMIVHRSPPSKGDWRSACARTRRRAASS